MGRTAQIQRTTTETRINLTLDLDGTGSYQVNTPVPFLNHMLALFARQGLFDLRIEAKGDTEIDYHHTVEDIGICLGAAIRQALAEKQGIRRYGHTILPMDESLVMLAVDISGRPYLVFDVMMPVSRTGDFDTALVEEFLRALANHAGITLHVKLIHGKNVHHISEAIFKALGRAIQEAVGRDPRITGVMSTKGKLE